MLSSALATIEPGAERGRVWQLRLGGMGCGGTKVLDSLRSRQPLL